jgi:hypothetical protein
LVAGIALGARSVTGERGAAALGGLSVFLALLRRARRPGTRAGALAGLSAWASLGFFEGRVVIARREEIAHGSFVALPEGRDRADRVEGVLLDFWSDAPPRARDDSGPSAFGSRASGGRFPQRSSSSSRERLRRKKHRIEATGS